jgi:hypothetical protein
MTEIAALKEGSRWRHERPDAGEVSAWFADQPLDEGMEHSHYVSGLILIKSSEKVQHVTELGTREVYEAIYTPYVTVNTRVRYFHALAEKRDLIPVIEPLAQPRIDSEASPFYNEALPEGYSWFAYRGQIGELTRYLVATWSVALYEPDQYGQLLAGKPSRPVRAGRASKQVEVDEYCMERAETGAIGRALGVAGILVVGSGVATAEDMQRVEGANRASSMPIVNREGEPVDAAAAKAVAIERFRAAVQGIEDIEELRTPFDSWWEERRLAEDWKELDEVPVEVLVAAAGKIEGATANLAKEGR